jgi:hypothetical protein
LRSNLLNILTKVDPHTCDEYELITLEEMAPQMIGVPFRPNYPYLENITRIIRERRDWAQRLIDETQLNTLCRDKLYQTGDHQSSYIPLSIYTLSGVVVTYMCAVGVTLFIFILELFVYRCKHTNGMISNVSIELNGEHFEHEHMFIDTYIDDDNDIVYNQYNRVLHIISNS